MVNFSADKCVQAFAGYYEAKKRAQETEHALLRLKRPQTEEELFIEMEKYHDGGPARLPADLLLEYATNKKRWQEAEAEDKKAKEAMSERKKEFDDNLAALIAAI